MNVGRFEPGIETLQKTTAVPKPNGTEWGCMTWTQYDPNYVNYDVSTQDYIELDVTDGVNNIINLRDPRSVPLSGSFSDANNNFRFTIRFLDKGVPLFDSPVFDDIRYTYVLSTPQMMHFKEVTTD